MIDDNATRIDTAEACGVSTTTLERFLNPEYRKRQNAICYAAERQRAARDPEQYAAQRRAVRERYTKRQRAYRVAVETGVPVEQVWAEWGVA